MNEDACEAAAEVEYRQVSSDTPEPEYDGGFTPDLHSRPQHEALEIIRDRVAELVEATTTKEGFLPRTVKMVINDKIIEMDRVIAAQYMKLMFIDNRVPNRPEAVRRFASLMKDRFSKAPYNPLTTMGRIQLEINAETLKVKSLWDMRSKNTDHSVGIDLPLIRRYEFEDSFGSVGEFHRFVWELGQATGVEIRHDGILPVFTVTIEHERGYIDVAKLSRPILQETAG